MTSLAFNGVSTCGSASSLNGGGASREGSKKPRVYFTEDQKEILRATYNEHPYPTPEVVERLSRTLAVGNKTISNWFHNHRMRAKLNPAAPLAPGARSAGKRPVDGPASGVVMTSFDDGSSFSDRSASPGDVVTSRCRSPSAEVNAPAQWLFPSFDSMASRVNDVTTPEDERSCEAEDLSVRSTSSASNVTSSKSSSRRKSSKPQWVFEGTQLDKSRAPASESAQEAGESDALKMETGVKNNNQGETSDVDSPTSGGEDDVSRTVGSDVASRDDVEMDALTSQRSVKRRRFGVVEDSCQKSARNSPNFVTAAAPVDVS